MGLYADIAAENDNEADYESEDDIVKEVKARLQTKTTDKRSITSKQNAAKARTAKLSAKKEESDDSDSEEDAIIIKKSKGKGKKKATKEDTEELNNLKKRYEELLKEKTKSEPKEHTKKAISPEAETIKRKLIKLF